MVTGLLMMNLKWNLKSKQFSDLIGQSKEELFRFHLFVFLTYTYGSEKKKDFEKI